MLKKHNIKQNGDIDFTKFVYSHEGMDKYLDTFSAVFPVFQPQPYLNSLLQSWMNTSTNTYTI